MSVDFYETFINDLEKLHFYHFQIIKNNNKEPFIINRYRLEKKEIPPNFKDNINGFDQVNYKSIILCIGLIVKIQHQYIKKINSDIEKINLIIAKT